MGGGEHSLNWEFFMPEGDGVILQGEFGEEWCIIHPTNYLLTMENMTIYSIFILCTDDLLTDQWQHCYCLE